ncbi:MAG: hypothetical protein CFH30_00401 [Alphaproteobacteria bacterium MarineAlpha8_Bin1]|nr:MAG: hypothetical protein CFH30_00401 [Alphaproteobacteria bacterium MarineAlpha8_Bin1]|tara:strand:+ start:87 stop:1130 length:1044 start_codon:yes stop_codon:yes gene_type:complete
MEKNKLKKFIKKTQSLSLSRFIFKCLYSRDSGYYQKKKIGSDFTTSPEISQMFGECISIFFININKIFKINTFCEFGPGNGTLARDLISTISKFLDKDLNFLLHEKSELLKNSQDKILKEFKFKNVNIDRLKNFKELKVPTFFICNEFFDSLPVNQFILKKNKWFEKRIILQNDKYKVIDFPTSNYLPINKSFHNGDIIEISPLSNLYLKKIFRHIKTYGGGLLFFDYGPSPKKKIDTIQALYNSEKCDFLSFPYDSDITYHVDFQEVKKIADSFNLISHGPIPQKKFLFFHGINERYMQLSKANKSEEIRKQLDSEFYRLVDPNGMGNLLKCMFVTNQKIKLDSFR